MTLEVSGSSRLAEFFCFIFKGVIILSIISYLASTEPSLRYANSMHMHMIVTYSYYHDSDRDVSSFSHNITSYHIIPYHVKCLYGHGHGHTNLHTFNIDDFICIYLLSSFSSSYPCFYHAFSLILTLFFSIFPETTVQC